MDGLRAGRVWVDHGGLDRRRSTSGSGSPATGAGGVPLGGVLRGPRAAPRSSSSITIDLATPPNWAQFVPKLARVDVIAGDGHRPGRRPDTFTHPGTKVVRSFEVGTETGIG